MIRTEVERPETTNKPNRFAENLANGSRRKAARLVTEAGFGETLDVQPGAEQEYLQAALAWNLRRKDTSAAKLGSTSFQQELLSRRGGLFASLSRLAGTMIMWQVEATAILEQEKGHLLIEHPELTQVAGAIDRATNLFVANLLRAKEEGLSDEEIMGRSAAMIGRFRAELAAARERQTR